MNEMTTVNSQAPAAVGTLSGSLNDMATRLNEMRVKTSLVQQFFKDVMVEEQDYGIIPGTQKPTLYKAGAEKLAELYGYVPLIHEKNEQEKNYDTGHYHVQIQIRLQHRGTGEAIADGIGEASTYESKYRYRWVFESDIPKGTDKTALMSKTRTGKGNKTYTTYRVENDDLFSQWNTVLKMAKKRALVDAVLTATRSSGLFTQSESQFEAWVDGEAKEPVTPDNTETGGNGDTPAAGGSGDGVHVPDICCSGCGKVVSEKVASFSASKYKKVLCMECQPKGAK